MTNQTDQADQANQYEALTRGDAVIAHRRDVITAIGPDAIAFLQGQLSQDVNAMANGESRLTLHLQPNGRLIGLARLTRIDNETVIIDAEQGVGERIRTGLARFLIRTKCVLTIEESVESVVWPHGPSELLASRPIGGLPLIVSALPFCEGIDIVGINRLPTDLFVAPSVDANVAEVFRIERGIPHSGAEFTESTIPSETSIIDEAVTFGKGCYVGQELVERIDSRGRVVRSLRRLVSEAQMSGHFIGQPDASGAEEVFAGADGVGHLTSLAMHPVTGKLIGIGLIRSTAPTEGLTVSIGGQEVAFRLVS